MLNSIHSDLIRGHIDTIILSVLHEGDRYGYDILGEIERKSGGTYVLKQPTLYSCLKRLETQGFIYKYWGTETNGGRRTYYSLTEMGKELFQRNKDEWKYSRSVIDKLISSPNDSSVVETVVETIEIPASEQAHSEVSEANLSTDFAGDDEDITPNPNDNAVDQDADNLGNVVDELYYSEMQPTTQEQSTDTSKESVAAAESEPGAEAVPLSYSQVLAEAEKNEILSDTNFASGDDELKYNDNIGFSYADRLANDREISSRKENDISESSESPLFALDYFKDADDTADDTVDEEQEPEEDAIEEIQTVYPSQAFYNPNDFVAADNSRQPPQYEEPPQAVHSQAYREETRSDTESVFMRYDNAVLSDETDRAIVVGREYLGVIKRLLSGDTDADTYYSKLREMSATTVREEPITEPPVQEAPRQQIVTETQPPLEPMPSSDEASFDDLLVSVRSMGDEIRIRTHNRAIDKEYNKLYHYYSNKLLLFKYGALFALMILEIVIPYFVIKFGLHISPIVGELPVLVLTVVGAALLPIYAISAYLIDPYKRKRYDFDLKSSILYRLGIMFLMLILVYAVNVVFRMDISFEAEYAFSLLTPALLSTNIPLSAVVFKVLYDSKQFAAE